MLKRQGLSSLAVPGVNCDFIQKESTECSAEEQEKVVEEAENKSTECSANEPEKGVEGAENTNLTHKKLPQFFTKEKPSTPKATEEDAGKKLKQTKLSQFFLKSMPKPKPKIMQVVQVNPKINLDDEMGNQHLNPNKSGAEKSNKSKSTSSVQLPPATAGKNH